MAKILDLDVPAWDAWVAARPACVQELCRRLPPDRLYAMAPTSNRVTIVSYAEDGTVRVAISAEFNLVCFEREVFGVNPDDLSECDTPSPDAPTGAMLTEERDIRDLCNLIAHRTPTTH